MGYYLTQTSMSFVMIDSEKRVGDTWRKRYDSLVLFTPRKYSSLPGMQFPGVPDGFPNKTETADYLESYATSFHLPIQFDTKVLLVTSSDGVFVINTANGDMLAKRVIAATGAFQEPFIPAISTRLGEHIYQVHSSSYKNPSELPNGPCLVAGGGNSGAQIAAELAQQRPVYISVGHKMKFLPQQIAGKSIFWWFDKLGILHVSAPSKIGSYIRSQHDPIFGTQLKKLLRESTVKLMPKLTGCEQNAVTFQDGTRISPRSIVWATGFKMNYGWLQIPGVLDDNGRPRHLRGVSTVQGLYFLGQPWQHYRGSSLIGGVGADAKFLYEHMHI